VAGIPRVDESASRLRRCHALGVPRVVVVAPAHNGVAKTLRFLETATALDFPDADIVLVDDGSTDGTSEVVASRFPEVTVLQGDGSLWWSGSTNLGVNWARGRGAHYVFAVNSDAVLDGDVLTRLVATAAENPRSLVGAMVVSLHDPTSVWSFGSRFDHVARNVRHVEGAVDDFDGVQDVELLIGMGMLVPMEVFEEIGMFDAGRFPQYFGDTDFVARARAAGYRMLVDANAIVRCDTGSSWVAVARTRPTVLYPFQLFFSRRSPENVVHRYRFYVRHWPSSHPRRALAHHCLAVVKYEVLGHVLPELWARARPRRRRG
jgi:GT2 family glycosyltransferase